MPREYEIEREEDIKTLTKGLKSFTSGTRLGWTDNAISSERPWGSSWVDAYIPEICEKAEMGWLLTVVSSKEMEEKISKGEERWDEIGMDFDAQIEILLGEEYPERVVYRYKDTETEIDWLGFLNYENEENFSVENVNAFDLNFEYAVRSTDTIEIRDGREWIIRPVWSPEGISNCIKNWASKVLGRDDLVFFWDSELGMNPAGVAAAETLDRIQSGEEETYDLGNGIKASGSAMDFLLEDPDRAVEVEEALLKFKKSAE